MVKKIAQIVLAVVIVGLIYVIYQQISTPIRFDKELAARQAAVIGRIKDIRTAQRAFKSKYMRFTSSFDSLEQFILNDTLELERKLVDEYDSVAMALLKKSGRKNVEKFKIAVIDTIFSPRKLTASQVKELRYIPFSDRIESRHSGRRVPRPLQRVPRHGRFPPGGRQPDRRSGEQLQPLCRSEIRLHGSW